MEDIEQSFQCPFCFEGISMVLDLSTEGTQTYIEDCEVCCRPIQISFSAADGELLGFECQRGG